MKKAVLIIAALVLCSTFAFAQASVGAWGRGIIVPVAGGEDMVMDTQASWGGAPRVGITISGSSDNVGFQVDFNGDGDGIGAGDQQKIWVKLFDMLTISCGRVLDDTLRGNAVFGAWNWVRYDVMDGEDAIFVRVRDQVTTYHGSNAVIAIAPTEGAYIYASWYNILGATALIEDNLPLGQFGGGYTIEGIGQIRVQYFGLPPAIDEDWGIINAAFKLTMVEGLVIDLGAGISTDSEQSIMAAIISLYASYSMDALTIHVYGDYVMWDEDFADAADADAGITVAAGVDYSMEGGIGINADVRWCSEWKTAWAAIQAVDMTKYYEDGTISGMVGVTMGFSNGLVGIGIELTTGNFAGLGIVKADASDMVICLPIRLEYWF